MKRFLIIYRDPESGEYLETKCEFKDHETEDGFVVTARDWAEDRAYTLARKGPYTVKEI